jgi:hypothetical protein
MSTQTSDEQALLAACVDMVRRTGANTVQVRYSDDEQPIVWMGVACYPRNRYEMAAGPTPEQALFRLLERLVDGGQCQHCTKPTGITDDFDAMPLTGHVCWYQFDPELKTFRRGCA